MGLANLFNSPLVRLFSRRAPAPVDVWAGVDLETLYRRTPLERELLVNANDDWPGSTLGAPANDVGPSAAE